MAAFRFSGQHLTEGRGAGGLLEAAGVPGVQNTPPGNGQLALLARYPALTPEEFDRALEEEKTLLQSWTVRQSPVFFPTSELAAATRPMLPEDEESWRLAVQGFVPMLDGMKRSGVEVAELVRTALVDALDGQVLTKRELGVALGERMPAEFAGWFEASTFSSFTAVLVRPLALTGLFVIAPRSGREAAFVRTDQWLGKKPSKVSAASARRAFVRSYLRAYGPSTPDHLAEWAGTSLTVASRAWQEAADELEPVTYGGGRVWVHAEDAAELKDPAPAKGVRVLPPHDPWLHMRDRTTAVPDTSVHKQIWKHTGNPGVVVRDGDPLALWRAQKKGKKLRVTVEPLAKPRKADRDAIEEHAGRMAPLKGCATAEVEFTD